MLFQSQLDSIPVVVASMGTGMIISTPMHNFTYRAPEEPIHYCSPEEPIRPCKSIRQLEHRQTRRAAAVELKVWEVSNG